MTPRLAALAGGTRRHAAAPGRRRHACPCGWPAVVDHFPGTTGDAVIGDIQSLQTAVNTQVPGRRARERDLARRAGRRRRRRRWRRSRRPPFRGVEAVSRADLLAQAHDDPLGHGTLIALDAAAVVALLLAALGLALTVLSDLRDDRGDLYDLEAQGAEPSLLRRIVRVRALVVGVAGVLAGAVAGALLALLVTRVVAATAPRDDRRPPAAHRVRPPRRRARRRSPTCSSPPLLVALATRQRLPRRSRPPARAGARVHERSSRRVTSSASTRAPTAASRRCKGSRSTSRRERSASCSGRAARARRR